jgi:hypothetical protein
MEPYSGTFYPAVILTLGYPKLLKTNSGVIAQQDYFIEFVKLAEAADVLGFKDRRYPLTKDDRLPQSRNLFDDFTWWASNWWAER